MSKAYDHVWVSIIANIIGHSRSSSGSLMRVHKTKKLLLDEQSAKKQVINTQFSRAITMWAHNNAISIESRYRPV